MPEQEVIQQKLEAARRELLDLTGRNRLLNTQRSSTRSSRLEIVDEKSQEVFRHLVGDGKAMSFLPGIDPDEEHCSETETASAGETESERDGAVPAPPGGEGACSADEGAAEESPASEKSPASDSAGDSPEQPSPLADFVAEHSSPLPPRPLALGQPDDEAPEVEEDGPPARHVDDKLQTPLTSEKLQKRLLRMFYDARTYEEEQGVNILFLAMGFLKWVEPDKSDKPRYAPLILIPVSLSRRSAGTKFRIRYDDEEIITNLSLAEKLKVDFNIELPPIPEEDLDPAAYFDAVRTAVASEDGWQVLDNDIVLWFFSFSKFLMYRDLQSENWPAARQIDEHPLVESLLTSGFASQPPLCGEEAHVDELLDPAETVHVTDADSSQAIAIEEVRRGRNLVIQGPPGTGKSQTITNLIATAVHERKKVLFVAEKMAALEVVKQRLDSLGLGGTCLELHSHKASKKAVLAELGNTLSLGCTRVDGADEHAEELRVLRDELNRHSASLAEPLGVTGVSASRAIGELIQLQQLGIEPPDFRLEAAREWTPADTKQRVELLTELTEHLEAIGKPREHPWYGVELESLLPTDRDRILAKIPAVLTALDEAEEAARELESLVDPNKFHPSCYTTTQMVEFVREILAGPKVDPDALANPAWSEELPAIRNLVAVGLVGQKARADLDGKVASVAWTADVATARVAIAAHGRSWFRIFNGTYRAAMATLRGILTGPPLRALEDRLALLDSILAVQQAEREIEKASNHELGKSAFGRAWNGVDSDWEQFQAFLDWACPEESRDVETESDTNVPDESELPPVEDGVRVYKTHDQVRAGILRGLEARKRRTVPRHYPSRFLAARRLADREDAQRKADRVEQTASRLLSLFSEICEDLHVSPLRTFRMRGPEYVFFSTIRDRLTTWQQQPEQVFAWIAFWQRFRRLSEHGLQEFSKRIEFAQTGPDELLQQFYFARAEELTRLAMETHPHLTEFSGASHEQLIAKFAQLDMEGMLLARKKAARIHYEKMPTTAGNIGQVGIVRREIQKKRQHLPLRRLFAEAGRAVQAIKPVFMMSPTSIAQFLAPGQIEFDILVIDEASQVPPVDALGAVARSQQIVVVGDDKQLPPTRFFQKMADDNEEATSGDDFQAADMESILSLCSAQNVSQRMLRWHYRSRHHSLISVSNREFYHNQLNVIPSPDHESEDLGLRFRFIEDGVFDSGGTATNQIEAEAVVTAVMQHAKENPRLTLGVGTFSVAQRNAILDELEVTRREHPELEKFFDADRYEPFFVKNLENIQGDERDVILISIGYAKDDEGKLRMNFGPLSNEGGERRLNVLITRARRRCEVFSSMRADEIDLSRTKARGTAALKTFLHTAEQGVPARDFDDDSARLPPLEIQIAEALSSRGYEVDRRIGIAGLFVDLAIKDPDEEGRYLLGIECDGEDYHSARSARDRDRIHTNVLRRQGWDIHRVWTVDWLNQPTEQLDRLVMAAVEAKQKDRSETSETTSPPADLERTDAASVADLNAPLSVPYEEASFKVERSPQDLSPGELAKTVKRVLDIEAPIHMDELYRSVGNVFSMKRTGDRAKAAILEAVELLVQQKTVTLADPFVSLVNGEVQVRDRSALDSSSRHPDMLPPVEMQKALVAILRDHFGVRRDELIVEAGRLFGFRSTSSVLKERLSAEIGELLSTGEIEDAEGWLHSN